jgi:hypothetical protein
MANSGGRNSYVGYLAEDKKRSRRSIGRASFAQISRQSPGNGWQKWQLNLDSGFGPSDGEDIGLPLHIG